MSLRLIWSRKIQYLMLLSHTGHTPFERIRYIVEIYDIVETGFKPAN